MRIQKHSLLKNKIEQGKLFYSVYCIAIFFIFFLVSISSFSQINTFPYSESFETNFGAWTNVVGDDFDWTRRSGGTPSGGTGPSSATAGNWYVYTEASWPNYPSKRAYLEITFDFTGEFNPKLSFYYHMYGSDMGNLYIDVYDGVWNNAVSSIIGQQQTSNGAAWRQAVVDLTAFENRSNIKVRFRGVTGTSGGAWQGDMAVDNISVCTINPGVATISTKMLCAANTVNLSLTGQDAVGTIQWQQSTDNVTFANIGGATSANYTTGALATGSSYYYRALVTNGCTNYSNTVSVVVTAGSGAINVFPYSEGFEANFGAWTNVGGDDFNWTRDQGGTPSNQTGPSTGNGSTWYVYTEASNPNNPSKKTFLEATFDFSNVSDPEITFYYHMAGIGMGTLYLDVGTDQSVWSISGAQQTATTDSWKSATVNLSTYRNLCNVTIRFRGVTGSWSSDMAIDDIFIKDACLSVNGGTASISNSTLCAAGTVDLSLIGQNGGATLQWQQSTDNITFANIGGATSANYTTGALATGNTYYYRAAVTNVCTNYSDTVSVIVNAGGGISAFPYSEGFETGFGAWANVAGDDFNWTRDQAGTPSGGTGPSTGNGSTWYVYTEASGANNPNKKTFLEANFDFTGVTTPTLSFYYHMYGSGMGSLYVDANGVNLWSISGQQQTSNGAAWKLATIDLSAYANLCNVTIRFRGITGSSFRSDMAVDDIAICTVKAGTASISKTALCAAGTVNLSLIGNDAGTTIQWQQSTDNITFANIGGATTANYTTGILATGNTYYFRAAVTNGCTNYSTVVSVVINAGGGGISAFPYSEGFETGLGAWANVGGDDMNWTRNSNGTPSNATGPIGATEGRWYMYTEASNPNNPNKRAYLEANFDFTALASPQLTFSYHMFGIQTGALYLDANGTNVWSISGQQNTSNGEAWKTATVDLSAYAGECYVVIRFRGVTGSGYRSDISFDDIGVCSKPITSAITGNSNLCKNTLGEAYSVTNNVGNTYTWIFDGGVQATGGTTNSITVNWGGTGKVGSLKTIERSGTCVGDTVNLTVNIHTIATSTITGDNTIGQNTLGKTYSVTNTVGYSYAWTITGGIVAAGQGTNSITVNWGVAGAGNVAVIATSGAPSPVCTTAPVVNLPVTIYSVTKSVASGNWNNAATWDCVCVPIATDNVEIMNTHIVALTANQTIDNIIINVGATLNNAANILTVTSDYTNNGTHSGTGAIKLTGVNSNIDGIGIISNTADLEIRTGNKTILATANLTKSSGNINIINPNLTITNNGSITIAGNLIANNGTNQWINASNSSLIVGGTLLSSGILVASASSNSVGYNGTVVQSIKYPDLGKYYNLNISGTNTKNLSANIIINNNITISGTSQLDATAANNNINLLGNWSNTSGNANPFVERNSTVSLKGTVGQTITNTNGESFYKFTVNKASGKVILGVNTNITISNLLTLTKGIVDAKTNGGRIMLLGSSSATASSASSFVDGIVRKTGNTPFIFPLGNGTTWARLGITAPDNVADAFEASYTLAKHIDANNTDATLNNSSVLEYWDLTEVADFGAVTSLNATLYFESATNSNITDFTTADLVVAHYTGGKWINAGQSAISGTNPGTVTSNALTTFSPFTFGSKGGLVNPLPIELISFNAQLINGEIQLDWQTASEINNDYFTIERTANGIDFEWVDQVDGAGNSNEILNYRTYDTQPFEGVSYYRLKQTDFDGQFEYSNLESINNIKFSVEETVNFEVFPNPSLPGNATLTMSGLKQNQEVLIVVKNILGQQLYSKIIISNANGSVITAVDPNQKLAAGTYLITGSSNNNLFSKKLIIK